MYQRMPTLQEMEAAGFLPEDYETDEVEVLPENWPAIELFSRVSTQWRVGALGATGLDYGVLYPLLDKAYPISNKWFQAFDDIRLMESEALAQMKAPTQ